MDASGVGNSFVQIYYETFQHRQESMYRFYKDSSTVIRVDGDTRQSVSNVADISELIMSLNLHQIEVETINSLESWNGGILVVVSGFGKTKDFSEWRKFVQTFFLAPQEMGYFVLNDMFHFSDNGPVGKSSVEAAEEHNTDYQMSNSYQLPDPPVSDHSSEAVEEYISSIHSEGEEPVPEYGYQDQASKQEAYGSEEGSCYKESSVEPQCTESFVQEPHSLTKEHESSIHSEGDEPVSEYRYQDQVSEAEVNGLEEDSCTEEQNFEPQSTETFVQEPYSLTKEPAREPENLTYASMLRAKGKSPQEAPQAVDKNHVSQHSVQRPIPVVPKSSSKTNKGLSHTVYVKNLPPTVTTFDILKEFKNFGKINYDGGVYLKHKDDGVCFAFVKFEDIRGVETAIRASPIQLLGRQVYIEQRRSNNDASSFRGERRGGRGSGGRDGRGFGRGIEQNSVGSKNGSNGFSTR